MFVYVNYPNNNKITQIEIPDYFEYLIYNRDEEGYNRYESLAIHFRAIIEEAVKETPFEAYETLEDARHAFAPIISW